MSDHPPREAVPAPVFDDLAAFGDAVALYDEKVFLFKDASGHLWFAEWDLATRQFIVWPVARVRQS